MARRHSLYAPLKSPEPPVTEAVRILLSGREVLRPPTEARG